MYIEHQYNESMQFMSCFRRMTKDAREHFFAIQYFDYKQIHIMPKILCFELINTKDECSKYYFRIYESSQIAEGELHANN